MIKRATGLPTFSMFFEHPDLPGIKMVQVAADSRSVTVAYLDHLGVAQDVREFSVSENPELNEIVQFYHFDDVWNGDLLMALVMPVDPNEQAPALEPLIPAYLQSIQATS